MDFGLTEDQKRYIGDVVRFAADRLEPGAAARDQAGEFSTELWRECAHFGIQGLCVPNEYGGQGADPLTIVLTMEALGYGCSDNGLLFSLNAQMWSCEVPLVRFGTQQQRERYLPGLCDGSLIAAHAITEPEAGSDVFALTTTARQEGDYYVLEGAKAFSTNAPVADLFLVFARLQGTKGVEGVSVFLLDRDTPGLTLGPPQHKMGLRTSPMGDVFLDGCKVPSTNLLGRPGLGMVLFNTSMEWERGFILACALGSMQRQLEGAIAYTKERRQFGEPISKFQAVSHRIVDMKLRLEASRLLIYRLGWLVQNGQSSPMDAALAKLQLSECFLSSSLDALQVRGGYGYLTDSGLERDVRDAVAGRIYSGTSEIQRNIIARFLGL